MTWVKQAWDLVTPEIVKKSFKKCGISNAMDGTEDDLFNMNDNEGTFEGFNAADLGEAQEHNANILSGIENEAEFEIDVESDNDSAHEEDLDYKPMSPGH